MENMPVSPEQTLEAPEKDPSENIVFKRNHFYAIMVVLLHASETRELRIHETQFLRFEAEYRIESKFDHETRERVLRLLTLKDETVN